MLRIFLFVWPLLSGCSYYIYGAGWQAEGTPFNQIEELFGRPADKVESGPDGQRVYTYRREHWGPDCIDKFRVNDRGIVVEHDWTYGCTP